MKREATEAPVPQLCMANCGNFVHLSTLIGEPGLSDELCSSCAREQALGSRGEQVLHLLERAGFGPDGLLRRYRGYSLKRVLEPKDREPFPKFMARVTNAPQRSFGVHAYNLPLVEIFRRFGPDDRLGLYVTGKKGVGKTAAVAALAQDLIEEHLLTVAFYRETEFFDLLSAQGWTACHPGGVLWHCEEAALLVLDDVGQKVAPPSWMVETLEALVTYRYHAERPMICTSNLDVGSYIKLRGEHLGSKLIGAIQRRQVPLLGYDWQTREIYEEVGPSSPHVLR